MIPIQTLHTLGQSLWYDNIQRGLLIEGGLARLISVGDIRGVTSNPSIFNHAITKTSDYDSELLPLIEKGVSSETIFWQLAIEDICAAADLFLPLYQDTGGGDGYVSLEVNPLLAQNTAGTIDQVRELWHKVNRPNLMVKIPATIAGLPAITQAISEGINVNVTLIFSLERYVEVMDAYITGIKHREHAGLPIIHVGSVASFFISRVDTKVDGLLDGIIKLGGKNAKLAQKLLGKAAIANARLAYEKFESRFLTGDFKVLANKGARKQRPLWASTSTKNPAYRDVMYIEELIGPDTVNTVPPQTLDAFRDHGIAQTTIRQGLNDCHQIMYDLESLGISMDLVTSQLEQEGVKAFADAFTALLQSIDSRRLHPGC
jgi:transaldolase